MANTHVMYNTVEHEHLDCLVFRMSGEYPSSGLLLAGCEDGRWFVEVDFGDEYDQCDGVSRPSILPYKEPEFFGTRELAFGFAVACIKKIHPELQQSRFPGCGE